MTPSAPRCARPPGTATGAARSPRTPEGRRRDQPACAAAGAGRGAGPRPRPPARRPLGPLVAGGDRGRRAARAAARVAPRRPGHQAHQPGTDPLPRHAHRARPPALHHLQVPDPAGRRGAPDRRAAPLTRRAPLHAGRAVPQAQQARRDPAAPERVAWRHEPGRAAADPSRLPRHLHAGDRALHRTLHRPAGHDGACPAPRGLLHAPARQAALRPALHRQPQLLAGLPAGGRHLREAAQPLAHARCRARPDLPVRIVRAGALQGAVEVPLGGFNLSPFEAVGLLLAVTTLVRQIPAHRLYLYRTPTNRPMVCFVLFSALAGLFGGDLLPRLRDVAYFSASGFLLVFLVVSGEVNDRFVVRATRVVALAAVAVSLLGILEIALETHPTTGGALLAHPGTPRIASTLGSPIVLAAYLVLGVPLVLVELAGAERREERDFWLICTTLVIVAIVLTQSRTGLLALWITGSVFTWRASRRTFRVFAGGCVLVVGLLMLTGSLRLSPGAIRAEWARRVSLTGATISSEVRSHRALVGPEPGKGAVSIVEVEGPGELVPHRAQSANMHLTLMLRAGFVGWALMMWVIGAALAAIYDGSRRVQDHRLSLVLWAIFSSGLGFLVSMANFNAFYNPPVQILFWGLLGIGMAIVTHLNGRRPTFNVIYRFGQGE